MKTIQNQLKNASEGDTIHFIVGGSFKLVTIEPDTDGEVAYVRYLTGWGEEVVLHRHNFNRLSHVS